MNEVDLENQIRGDLRRSPVETVVYLEGATDPEIFFALLGLARPLDDIHEGILIKGLSNREGSGSTAVKARVDLANRLLIPRVFGVLDGDGHSLATLAPNFDAPPSGPSILLEGVLHRKPAGQDRMADSLGFGTRLVA